MANCLDLTDRVAVVIGGTSGIGRALSVGLQQHGAHVVPSGRSALRHAADVTSRPSLERLRDGVLEEFGRIDILVNAAGITFRQPTENVTEKAWTDLIDTTLTGVLRACQVFYDPLKASG